MCSGLAPLMCAGPLGWFAQSLLYMLRAMAACPSRVKPAAGSGGGEVCLDGVADDGAGCGVVGLGVGVQGGAGALG